MSTLMHNKVTPIRGGRQADGNAVKRPHVIAVTSGKGGVGKTNIASNLAIGLARQGHRVCILDADTGLANINILLGLTPRFTLEHVLDGSHGIADLMIDGPRGIKIIPGASGIARFADLDRREQQILFNGLQQIESQFDYLIVDTAAGIHDTVLQFVKASEQALLVLSPDPTSLTDCFALTRLLLRQHYAGELMAVVNMAEGAESARKVFARFSAAVQKYLHQKVRYLGHVSSDRAVVSAVRLQHPVMLVSPESSASRCLQGLADTLHQCLGDTAGMGFARYWRDQQEESAVEAPSRPLEIVAATPTQSTRSLSLEELNKRFIESIQDGRGGAEEFVAAIKPIVDAYVARFNAFPIDIRDAVYRYLELADFPEQEIRNQLNMLEQLYEQRYQRPLMDKEDSLFRLLNQVRDSEPEFAAAIQRLQDSYERQYRPEPIEAIDRFLARLDAIDADAEEFERCIDHLRKHYEERFGLRLADEMTDLRKDLDRLARDAEDREVQLQQQLVSLTRLIARSQEGLGQIRSLRERVRAQLRDDEEGI